mmetsp:Transcript_13997/g.17689  ORF Transcript_13997/g.17689 Transcript_13997/m.17689 type:complete len:98 (-) Transcript_13997:1468-1761(-)
MGNTASAKGALVIANAKHNIGKTFSGESSTNAIPHSHKEFKKRSKLEDPETKRQREKRHRHREKEFQKKRKERVMKTTTMQQKWNANKARMSTSSKA